MQQRITLGILAQEFMDDRVGGKGGFGWAALNVARLFRDSPDLGVDVVFLAAKRRPGSFEAQELHGIPVVFRQEPRALQRAVRAHGVDLILTIDYRPAYHTFLEACPRLPLIVWSRDPRSSADVAKVNTLRLPDGSAPRGIDPVDCTGLRREVWRARLPWRRRPVLLATKGEGLEGDARDTYGVAPMGYVLPNPSLMEVRESEICKSATPKVLFLGRLDPIKRPWLFAELARRFPEVEFHMAGQSHFKGEGGWVPHDPPPNLHLRGHLTDEAKREALTTSWVLVNTSIHEFAPVSGFEAMVCKTPVISMEDSGRLASRFGVFAGRFDGDGMEGMDALEGSLRSLIGDDARRTQMGETARRWVLHHHGREPFLAAFARLCMQAGILPPRF